ncbi:CU044_2847 family protein [Streptomyces sp. S.PB5]|uniref:CU044_2847 family protein n=1 Tax=Streptomyces sp. S.PB5 TaxID=3020844 RepID=UPI0025B1831E|nr:CU044_2847 family protein [Streptomyces sp. S.PB5]MDN3027187.1 CU044_2847 family protein [Streptomyces sp. S.PB5]
MAQLVRIPLENGEFLIAEVDRRDIPEDAVVLASPDPGRPVAQASRTVESSLRTLRPALTGLTDALSALSPQAVSIEFGVKLGGETGVILAKGTAEVHFTVNVQWTPRSQSAEPSDA